MFYPGRADHPDHAVARRLLGEQFGNMVTFEIAGGRETVNRFMQALRSIPFGTAYALWTGIGAAGTVIVGMTAFGEPTDLFRVTCLALIIAGMVGLKLATG